MTPRVQGAAALFSIFLVAPPMAALAAQQPAEGKALTAAATPTTIAAGDIAFASRLRDAALQKNIAYDVLESLTSEIGHRLAGSDNDARGRAWAIAKLEALGFDRVYTEPVTFPRWVRRSEQIALIAPYPHQLAATALGGSVGTDGPLEAEVVMFDDLDALRTADRALVEGRIAYVSNRMTRAIDGASYGPTVRARVAGASIAASLGARALLIRSIGTSNNRFAHTGIMTYDTAHPKIPAASISVPDAILLENIARRGKPLRARLDLDVGWEGDYTSHNVIGEITGASKPDEIVAIGGHLDSWDKGTGALDDGVGCAITIAAAHAILESGRKPARTVRVVLFANEEQGLYGGKAYAAAHADAIGAHQIASESDSGAGRVWRFDTRIKPEAFGAARQIAGVLAPLGIKRGLNSASGGPDFGPLREKNAAVFSLAQDSTNYFDYHHTDNDTLDKVDPAALDQNVAAWVAAAWLFANANGDFGSGTDLMVAPTIPRR